MAPPLWYDLIALLIGLLLGSFLNVCISRLPRSESVVHPGSHCRACLKPIRWRDNVPVLSFVLLRARCRNCSAGISSRYPLIELATALWSVVCARMLWHAWVLTDAHQVSSFRDFDAGMLLTVQGVGIGVLGFLLLGLIVMDWETLRLPDAFTLSGIAIGFFLVCAQAMFLNPGQGQVLLPAEHIRLRSPGSGQVEGNVFLTGPEALVMGRVAAIVGAALLLAAIRALYRRIRHREGMGAGDVKLLAMIAAFLGFGPSVLAFFVGIVTAALYGVFLLARGRAHAATRLPFGSFLAAGGLVAALLGSPILTWYAAQLR